MYVQLSLLHTVRVGLSTYSSSSYGNYYTYHLKYLKKFTTKLSFYCTEKSKKKKNHGLLNVKNPIHRTVGAKRRHLSSESICLHTLHDCIVNFIG